MAVVVIGAALLASCEVVTGIGGQEYVGALGFPDDLAISVPDTVTAGSAFTVSVRTFGSNGCWRSDRTELRLDGLTATVVPYDIDSGADGRSCTQAIVELHHERSLAFAEPGKALVRIEGRDGTVERPVVVEIPR